jgi:hypothetical protein
MERLVAPGSAAGRLLESLLQDSLKLISASSTYPQGTLERLVGVLRNYQNSHRNRCDDADANRESVIAATLSAIEHGSPPGDLLSEIIGTFEPTLSLKVSWVPPLLGLCDRRVLKLLRQWLKAGVPDGGEFLPSDQGVPQGGVISCVLANVVLHELDRL